MTEIKVNLFRFDPAKDSEPRYETHMVEHEELMRVQDVLDYLIEKQGVSLGYRWFCGVKKCGVCGVTLNGRPILACWEQAPKETTLEPLANFPIIRDLVVDTSAYERFIQSLHPMIRRETVSKYPEVISQNLMKDAYSLMPCIECWVCTSAVRVAGLARGGVDWEKSVGPAALVLFAKAALDARDKEDRKPIADRISVANYPNFQILSKICPNGIDINIDAIAKLQRKYYGGGGSGMEQKVSSDVHERIFVRARTWSAFIRISTPDKEVLISNGLLQKVDYSQVTDAYLLAQH